MKEMNPLERQLRSGTPRRPSARLERRLFPRAMTAARRANLLGLLVPSTACLLFVCLVLNQQSNAKLPVATPAGAMVAVILSNQSYAAYLPGSFQHAHNQLDALAWNSGSSSAWSNESISPRKAGDRR